MSDQLLAATYTNEQSVMVTVVVSLATVVLVTALLVMDLKYIRDSRRIAREMNLPKGQWLRIVRTLVVDPIFEFILIASLLFTDMLENWEHVVAAVAGAALGVWVGHYRYRIQYVRADPEHKAIVFVRSTAEYVALSILVLVKLAAEQHQIPVVGSLTLLVTFLLALVLFESIGRSWFSYRRYVRDTAAAPAA